MKEFRVHVEASGRRIQPFGDPVATTPVQNRPLAAWQAEAIAEAGFQRIDEPEPPCLVIPDTLLATGGALRTFCEGAAGRNAHLVLKRSRFGTATHAVQPGVAETADGWRFESIRFVNGSGDAPVPVLVDPQEQVHEFPVPRHYFGADVIELGIPRHPVITLHHWVHILWANQYAGGIELRSSPKWKIALRTLTAAMRGRSLNKWKVLGQLNRIGRGCDIHPTAVIEGSTLGDGVTVGPHARVLFSTIGDRATVMPAAQVELCVLGERSIVSQQTVLRLSVLFPEAVAGQYLMQQCVLGRQAVTTGGAFTIDLHFERNIRVPLDGALHDTGVRFLGAAFGHRCRIGTGFWLAPGRMVPNDFVLLRDPRRVLGRLADQPAAAGPYVADGPDLRPLGTSPTLSPK